MQTVLYENCSDTCTILHKYVNKIIVIAQNSLILVFSDLVSLLLYYNER